jgi:hypothetical protein
MSDGRSRFQLILKPIHLFKRLTHLLPLDYSKRYHILKLMITRTFHNLIYLSSIGHSGPNFLKKDVEMSLSYSRKRS